MVKALERSNHNGKVVDASACRRGQHTHSSGQ